VTLHLGSQALVTDQDPSPSFDAPLQGSTRAYTHVLGFGDQVSYVVVKDEIVYCVDLIDNEVSIAPAIKAFEVPQFVQKGSWIEIPVPDGTEALILKSNPSQPTLGTNPGVLKNVTEAKHKSRKWP